MRLPTELYDRVYRRTLGIKGGMSAYLRELAERDLAEPTPNLAPEDRENALA